MRVIGWGLVVLASLALALAVLTGYVNRVAVNSDQFANRASVVLADPAVKRLVADRLTDQAIEQVPALGVVRSLIHSVAASIVGTAAFSEIFHAAVLAAHRDLVSGSTSRLTLQIASIGPTLAAAVQEVDPSAAQALRSAQQIVLVSRNVGSLTANVARDAKTLRWLWIVFAVASLICAALAIAVSRPRRWAIRRLGIGVLAVGALLLVGLLVGRSVAVGQAQGADAQAAVGAIWDAYLTGLRTVAFVLVGIGLVVALLARGGRRVSVAV